MVTLARTADRLYWGARYIERAEDTARIIRAYMELVADYPSRDRLSWEPLVAIHGSPLGPEVPADDPAGEKTVMHLVVVDADNPSSIAASVDAARANLRTTREVMPREAWQAVNQLSQYVAATAPVVVERRLRDHFLLRVVEISRRLDGILESTMTRSDEYRILRLGRLVERADMTTRVLGVAAASILYMEQADSDDLVADEVRWMSVLRSVSALQMYQRAVHGPIDGIAVVRFLLGHRAFPRSVRCCFDEIRAVLAALPRSDAVIAALEDADRTLASAAPVEIAGAQLDRAMDAVQSAIGDLSEAIQDTYVNSVI